MDEQVLRIAKEVMDNKSITPDKLNTIKRYTKRAMLQIKAHCNRNDIPDVLEEVTAQIVEDMLIADKVISVKEDVSSISRGDTSISYRDSSSAYQKTIEFMKNYECQLSHFKKMKLPKDVPDYE